MSRSVDIIDSIIYNSNRSILYSLYLVRFIESIPCLQTSERNNLAYSCFLDNINNYYRLLLLVLSIGYCQQTQFNNYI